MIDFPLETALFPMKK